MLPGVVLSVRTPRSVAIRYILAIALTLAFLLTCRWLHAFVGDNLTFLVLTPVVAFVAWYCGVGPSLITIVLVIGGTMYWLIPEHSLSVPNPAQSAGALAF